MFEVLPSVVPVVGGRLGWIPQVVFYPRLFPHRFKSFVCLDSGRFEGGRSRLRCWSRALCAASTGAGIGAVIHFIDLTKRGCTGYNGCVGRLFRRRG